MRRVRAVDVRATSYALVLALAGLLFALIMMNGCGRRAEPPSKPSATWSPSWLSPRAAEAVGGTVPLEVALPPNASADEVRFYLDGQPVGAARGAPWSLAWEAPESGEARDRVLSARAFHLGEAASDSASIRVHVEPDAAPRAWVKLPGRALWIEQGRGALLTASALDPEDGPLDATAFRWLTELLAQPIGGATLSADALAEGTQRVALEARDRRHRAAKVELELTPFHYREAAAPGDCVWNLAAALSAMDVPRARACFDQNFRFIPCGDEGPWTEEVVTDALTNWCADERVSRVECQWDIGAPRYFEIERERRAFCEVHLIGQHYLVDADSTVTGPRPGGTTISSREGRMTFELVEATAGWRIAVWREEAPKIGPSLADLIRVNGVLPASGRPSHRTCGGWLAG